MLWHDIKHTVKYILPHKWKYWIIKPKTINIGYHDASELILHTNMQILCDFYEKQINNGHVDWQADNHHKQVFATMVDIYNWWKYEYPNYDTQLEQSNYSSVIDRMQTEDCNNMLKRLMSIRQYMWD